MRKIEIVRDGEDIEVCRIMNGKRCVTHRTNEENYKAVDFLSDLEWVFKEDDQADYNLPPELANRVLKVVEEE